MEFNRKKVVRSVRRRYFPLLHHHLHGGTPAATSYTFYYNFTLFHFQFPIQFSSCSPSRQQNLNV